MTKQSEPKSAKSEKPDRREALLEAAERLFAEKGYAAVGTREIADLAGVNLGMIQYYFGSKGKLFIEVVHRAMRRGAGARARAALQDVPADPDDAAVAVCRFIQVFMGHLLRPEGPQACRIVFREVLGDRESEPEVFEALVSSVSAEFTRPLVSALANVLRSLAPDFSATELELSAQSIAAQCVFYLTHRAFLERECGECLAEPQRFECTSRHIASFSLRALGCDEARIERATETVFGPAAATHERSPPPQRHTASR